MTIKLLGWSVEAIICSYPLIHAAPPYDTQNQPPFSTDLVM